MKSSFGPGEDLPGRVMKSGKPEWITDVTLDANFPRAQLGESIGLKAGFAFPVSVGGDTGAVLEFFAENAGDPDQHLLHMVGHIGTQLGRILERERSETELKDHRDHLQNLVDAATKELKDNAEELKKALAKEQELNKLQREFVSMASHEFRTPLAIIDMAAQRLKRRVDEDTLTPEDTAQRVAKIRAAVQRMTRLMESTLDAARMEEGKINIEINPCDIGKIIRNVCSRQQEMSPFHVISCQLTNLPDVIQADSGCLEQVFTNLLVNAVKYAPDAPDIAISANLEDEHVIIQVRDNGIGIDADDLDRIGDRFFRAKTSVGTAGTGIGLNLAKTLVEMHGGSIGVESQKGKGATFTVHLPITGPVQSEHREVETA